MAATPKAQMMLDDDPEILLAKKRIRKMDTECWLSLRVLGLVVVTLGACVYCMYYASSFLLVIMMVCACCVPAAPMLFFPLICSLACYVLTHIPTMEQVFTVAEDIYEFHEKYKNQ